MLDKRAVGEAVASAVASLRCFIRLLLLLLQERGWSSWRRRLVQGARKDSEIKTGRMRFTCGLFEFDGAGERT